MSSRAIIPYVCGSGIASGKVYIDGVGGFWSYGKQRLVRFHGFSKEKFPLYLEEMEFQYDNRHKDVFDILAQNLSSFVSDLS